MKQPNDCKYFWLNSYYYDGPHIGIKRLIALRSLNMKETKKLHAWLGRVIEWDEGKG